MRKLLHCTLMLLLVLVNSASAALSCCGAMNNDGSVEFAIEEAAGQEMAADEVSSAMMMPCHGMNADQDQNQATEPSSCECPHCFQTAYLTPFSGDFSFGQNAEISFQTNDYLSLDPERIDHPPKQIS